MHNERWANLAITGIRMVPALFGKYRLHYQLLKSFRLMVPRDQER